MVLTIITKLGMTENGLFLLCLSFNLLLVPTELHYLVYTLRNKYVKRRVTVY